MWRFSYVPEQVNSKVLRFRKNGHQIKCCRRCYERLYATDASTPKSSSSSHVGRVVVGLLGVSLAVGGGTVVYAKYDSKFRKQIETAVPYADKALEYILGKDNEKESEAKISRSKDSKQTSTGSVNTGLLQKKLEREAAKKQSPEAVETPIDAKPIVSSEKPAPSTASTKSEASTASPAQQEAKPESKPSAVSTLDPSVQQRVINQDAVKAVENLALESIAEESMKDLNNSLLVAVTAYKEAMAAVHRHIETLQKALDAAPDENQLAEWNSISTSAIKKESLLSEASKSNTNVRKCIEKLKTIIQDGHKSKITTTNPILISAEEAVNVALYELQRVESEVSRAQSEAKILSEYNNLVEKGREEFQKEIKNLLPEVKVSEKGKKLSEEELNYLIAHAYRKVDQLNKRLSSQQASELARVQQALTTQKQEYEKMANSNLNVELDRLQRDLQISYQKKFNELNEEFEQELLQQLRRQAAAHSEHLRDVLNAQRKELIAEYNRLLEDKVGDARHEFQLELASSLGRLKGIQSALQGRSEVNRNIHKAQSLRVACQTLQHSVQFGHPDAKTWEEQRKPLTNEVTAISNTAGEGDQFVQAIVGAIPEGALLHGVYTMEALKDRFFRVDEVCRQVAMIDDHGGSLTKYALSYLQSLFVFADPRIPDAELADEPMDFSKLNTFDILDRARWCIDRDNLEQALRYMNLLRGAPRKVAGDWLKETRMTLEIKQAAEVLLTRAEAQEATGIIQ